MAHNPLATAQPTTSFVQQYNTREDDDDDDDDDDAATQDVTYKIAHVDNSVITGKSSRIMNYNHHHHQQHRGGRTEELQEHSSSLSATTTKVTKPNRYSNFTAWKRKKDSKIVGLKHYGLDSPRHQLHHTLSDDDPTGSSSNHSKSNTATQHGNKHNLYGPKLPRFHHPPNNNKYNTTTSEFSIDNDHHNHLHNGNHHHNHERKNRLFAVEKEEEIVRKNVTKNPFMLFYLGNLAALKVLIYYFITLETVLSCTLTTMLTIYWYNHHVNDNNWDGNSLNFILVAFTLTAPMTAALTMAFTRREQALMWIADFRSFSYHLYLAHALWDWDDVNGGRVGTQIDLVEHCDAVLAQLIGIGDELSRFLSLPSTSRSRHRHTKSGRQEASRTIEVAYHLLDSMATQRLTRLVIYSERLKKIGLPSGEISRVRQYERFISSVIEQLRMLKLYRTPQAFRSFARIFTLILPPFYAPTFAQVAVDVDSLGVGIAFGIITALGLVALFESHQILEDPFTAFLALDGIDVREEFEVLHYAQLTNTRKLIFPDAPVYPAARRAALTSQSMRFKKHKNKRMSPNSTILSGEALLDSPSVNTIAAPIVSLSSSSTTCLMKSPGNGDKYTSMFTANDDNVEVGTTPDDDIAINGISVIKNIITEKVTAIDVNDNQIDHTEESTDDEDTYDDDDDIELGTFIEDDDHTYRESIFVQPEQVLSEPDRYSHHHQHHHAPWSTHRRHHHNTTTTPMAPNHNAIAVTHHQGFLRSRHNNPQTTTQPSNATADIL